MRYYYLHDDSFSPDIVKGRWYFDDLLYVNNWDFFSPTVELMEPGTWDIDVLQDGVETDFSQSPVGIPVISKKLRDAWSDIPEIKVPYTHTVIEPVIVCNKQVGTDYFIMITEDHVECVDEKRSTWQKFTEDDPVRPDLAGQYDTFINLVIDPKKVQGRNIFRVKGKSDALIVSEEFKRRYDAVGATGAVFDSVMGDRQTIA